MQWDYEHANKYVNVADTLRKAMSANPFLKVFVGNGYYDLATPYYATQYTFNHLGLDPSLLGNVTMAYYEAGHMMYIHLPELARLRDDLVRFVKGSV
jgi:carboxypeptidase C (cathepsin A)